MRLSRFAPLLITLLAAALAFPSSALAKGGFWSTPTIHGYGRIHYVAGAAHKPDPAKVYKTVFKITKAAKSPDQVNGGLYHVARAVNIFAAAGVPLDHLKFVAVVAGPATGIVLDNAHYRAEYGVNNPNLALIRELRKAGVEVTVCAQAMGEHHFKYGWQAEDVSLSLSALSTDIILQDEGYALVVM